MDDRLAALESAAPLEPLLGYLNFSEGKPDVRFQKQLNDVHTFLVERGAAEPWKELGVALTNRLEKLKTTTGSPFKDSAQVQAVLGLVFNRLLPAYREHHADLLFHLSERDLFQPFFLARVCEAVLLQGSPWEEDERIERGALTFLNDFIGHRPIAILETRPQGEPYDHEKVRPIPLYIRGAGIAHGRYQALIRQALDVLGSSDQAVRDEASFDPELLDELALDPRAYDHGHPANRRPNYVFGEWDPHHLDHQGRYRRFVVRQVTLDAMLDRVEQTSNLDRGELLYEAGAVLAGTMLMASGVSGSSPSTHESVTSLSTLVPRIARFRDQFYAKLIETRGGEHRARLFQEMNSMRQPFGGARQHLNHYLAKHRAAQLQQRHLALLFAEMGYPEASRRQAGQIPTASIRVLSEIQCRLTTGQLLLDRGELAQASRLLPEIESLMHRGIAAGVLADPWNILGFQGLFPLFTAQEDSVRDGRIDDVIDVIGGVFHLYARLLSESAWRGERAIVDTLKPSLRRLAAWWDRFASTEVSDVRHVHGGEASASAEHVADALTLWHERGETGADLAFWKKHQQRFRSAKAFALVIDALLRKADYQTAMALLVTWLAQVEQVPLDDEEYSFHDLALRWLLAVTSAGNNQWTLVKKFFDYLEANAEDYWQVPELDVAGKAEEQKEESEGDDLYGAAYEDVTYKDSTDDDVEGSVSEGPAYQGEFHLEHEAERISKRLRFLATLSRLWQIAVQKHAAADSGTRADIEAWLNTAQANQRKLFALLEGIRTHKVPEPTGSYDSIVEYDRRRVIKEQLLYHAINTCLDYFLSVGTLRTVCRAGEVAKESPKQRSRGEEEPAWGPLAGQLEQALIKGDPAEARKVLALFLKSFRQEPLLFTALSDGGDPRQILRVRIAQTILRALAISLPRMGLLRETYHLLKIARGMEQAHPPEGRRVSQFNELFQAAYQAVVEAIVDAAPSWGPPARWSAIAAAQPTPVTIDRPLADLLEKLTMPFLRLWVEHARTMRIATLESVAGEKEWTSLKGFVQRFGRDLFTAKFMTLANLRGILHHGVPAYLDYLRDNPDPMHPVSLVDEIGKGISRDAAILCLTHVLQAIVENYEEYKDYKNTVAQSDYGENLHTLLDFLHLKAQYDRHAWHVQPLVLTHEVLVRKNQFGAAQLWREAFETYNREVAQKVLNSLAQLEKQHAMRLPTVADHLREQFVKRLDVDRLAALIKPAMDEANQEQQPSFTRLEQELQPYCTTTTGVGLDVPHWLQRLEHEVQRVWTQRSSLAVLAEHVFHIPKQPLALDDLQRQLNDWEKPIG